MTDTTKPPLSNPMADALAEDAAHAAALAAQAPPAAEVAETPETPPPTAAPEDENTPPVPETTKPRRTTEQVLQARIGALTAKNAEADRRAAEAVRQADAMRRLLEARGASPTPDAPADPSAAAPVVPGSPERQYTAAEVRAEAQRIAQAEAFNARANETYEAGKEKFGDWEAKMQTLRDTGLMSETLIDAAMSSDAPSDVLHFLGTDLAEAERIAALSPIKMGVELGKLAARMAAPAKAAGPRISAAPAPLSPISPASTAAVDFARLAAGDDMTAWVEARKKAGDPYAERRRR